MTTINPPPRSAFNQEDFQSVNEVFRYYNDRGLDPGYQGYFEEQYTKQFVDYMGGKGYADAVCTGTAAVFVALAALRLPAGSHVILSPITDPGTVSAIILNGLIPVLADAKPGSFNIGTEQFESRITSETRAAVIVHTGGQAAPIDGIVAIASSHNIKVVEDCSQAHGARLNGKIVGCFGDIAAFSTMYRKAHATGGCGGVVFTSDRQLYEMVRACADRGKPFFKDGFDEKAPGSFLFPALNLNLDEISCALGSRSLLKLDDTRRRRIAFLKNLDSELRGLEGVKIVPVSDEDSPFFHPVIIEDQMLGCTAADIGAALQKQGIAVNPHYNYVVAEWPWVLQYLKGEHTCPNAVAFKNSTFNLLFNENYGDKEIEFISTLIRKTSEHYILRRKRNFI
jgi:perosamine synthetase